MGAGDVFAFLGWYSKTLSVFTFLELEAKNTKTRCPCHWPPIGRDLCDAFLRFCVFAFLGPIRTGLTVASCDLLRPCIATRDSRLATCDVFQSSRYELRTMLVEQSISPAFS
jgi:hypothetical protein